MPLRMQKITGSQQEFDRSLSCKCSSNITYITCSISQLLTVLEQLSRWKEIFSEGDREAHSKTITELKQESVKKCESCKN